MPGAAAGFRVFAILWAVFQLMELIVWPGWLLAGWGWGVFFTASAVLYRPDSVLRFACLLVASVAKVFHEMPFLPNHVLFFGLQNLTMLAALVFVVSRHGRPVTPAVWFAAFAPLLRIQLVCLYLVSALQKLNHDYLDPGVSCATVMFTQIAEDLMVVPHWEWLDRPAIYASIAVEILVPLLLLVGRTRLLALVVGLLFHGFLGFHEGSGVFGFSFLMFVQYTLFFPAPVMERLGNVAHWPAMRVLKLGKGRALALLLSIQFFAVIRSQVWLYLNVGRNLEVFVAAHWMGQGFWLILTLWLTAGFVVVLRGGGVGGPMISRAGILATALAAMLVVGNAALPWIGSKTHGNFSMFSNLRTEFAENHLFLRRLHWVGDQDDMVEVLYCQPDIFDPDLNEGSSQQHSNTGKIMPMFELRRLAWQVEGALELEWVRGGKTFRAARDRDGGVTGDAEVFDAPGFWSRKLLWFRRHEKYSGPMHCTH